MAASLMVTGRTALCSWSQLSRVQPIASLGHDLVGQRRHVFGVVKPWKKKHRCPPVKSAIVYELKLPAIFEQPFDVTNALKRSSPEEQAAAKAQNRFRMVGPEEYVPLKPLQYGEVGLTNPAARAAFLENPHILQERVKNPVVVKDNLNRTRYFKLSLKVTGNDRLITHQFALHIKRMLRLFDCRSSAVLGIPTSTTGYTVIKFTEGTEGEARTIKYTLSNYHRVINITEMPSSEADLVMMMVRKYAPAGLDVQLRLTQAVGESGLATQDMKMTAARMAKKAVKSGGNVRYKS